MPYCVSSINVYMSLSMDLFCFQASTAFHIYVIYNCKLNKLLRVRTFFESGSVAAGQSLVADRKGNGPDSR
jgi:hypothetical protein